MLKNQEVCSVSFVSQYIKITIDRLRHIYHAYHQGDVAQW